MRYYMTTFFGCGPSFHLCRSPFLVNLSDDLGGDEASVAAHVVA